MVLHSPFPGQNVPSLCSLPFCPPSGLSVPLPVMVTVTYLPYADQRYFYETTLLPCKIPLCVEKWSHPVPW